jgi:transitional endoplasmic reticulum ATPase
LLRPGRLDRHVHVPIPDEEARRAIFEVHTRNKPLAEEVDLDELARRTENFVGADIEALVREATMQATREFLDSVDPDQAEQGVGNVRVTKQHFEDAFEEVSASIDDEVRRQYEDMEERFKKASREEEEAMTGRTFQ